MNVVIKIKIIGRMSVVLSEQILITNMRWKNTSLILNDV